MSYLRIMNKGTCDYRCFTLLGVSTSRDSNDKIGQFGSGVKFGTLTLLRNNIQPIIYVGRLKLSFITKPQIIDYHTFHQVLIKLTGQYKGSSINRTEETSLTLEHGVYDWKSIEMGLREYIANAIDANPLDKPTIDIVEEPRARAGYTQILIPANDRILNFINNIDDVFLHFSHSVSPTDDVLPKKEHDACRIYHKGVLVKKIYVKSVYDYNVDELDIDESRNSNEWEIRRAVAKLLGKNKEALKFVLRYLSSHAANVFESSLSEYMWNKYVGNLKEAYLEEFGDSILCNSSTAEWVARKGYRPVVLPQEIEYALRQTDIKVDKNVLGQLEMQGIDPQPPSQEMVKALEEVWNTLECLNLTNGKEKPKIYKFFKSMSGGVCTKGLYNAGSIFIQDNLSGIELTQTVIEEVVHHVTNSGDMSRDIQEFAFLIIAKILS